MLLAAEVVARSMAPRHVLHGTRRRPSRSWVGALALPGGVHWGTGVSRARWRWISSRSSSPTVMGSVMRNWRRNPVGVMPVSSRKTVVSRTADSKPERSAMVGMGRSVLTSISRTRSRRARRISSRGLRPRTVRNFRSRERRAIWVARTTSRTPSAVADVVADVADGGGEFGVGDGEDVGALAGDDFLGGDEDGGLGGLFAGEDAVEEGGGFIADAFCGDGDAGEGGGGEEADHGVVIDADDGDGFGDGDVEVAADFEDGPGDGVGGGEEGEWARERFEPLGDGVEGDGAFDAVVGGPLGHGTVGEFSAGEFFGEAFLAFAREVHVEGVDEGVVGEAAVEEVAGGDFSDAAVVSADACDAGVGVAVGDVDGGDVAVVESVGDLFEDERADDAVEVIDAGAGEFFGVAVEHVEDPGARWPGVGDDAAHDGAGVLIMQFQCNANMH